MDKPVLIACEMPMSIGMTRYALELAKRIPIADLCLAWFDPYAEKRYVHKILTELTTQCKGQVKNIPATKLPLLPRTINSRIIVPLKLLDIVKDYYIVHSMNHLSPAATTAAKTRGLKTIVTVHDVMPLKLPHLYSDYVNTIKAAIKKWRKCDAVITPSHATKRDLVSLGIHEKKIIVIYPAIDRNLFKPIDKYKAREKLNLPQDKFIILYLGSLEPKRALPMKAFLKALRQLRDKNILFVMAGPFKTLNPLRRDNIVVIKNPPTSTLPVLYNAANVFVFPTLYEGFGIPCLEAMACGTPVIAPKVASIPEVIGDAGILIDDPLNPREYKRGLRQAIEEPELTKYLARKALRRASQFAWEKSAIKLSSVYRNLGA